MSAPFEIKPGGFITSVGVKSVGDGPPLPAKELLLQGYALRWDTPIEQGKNNYMVFAKDSIVSPMKGGIKRLHFDHDESVTIATTESGLLLMTDEYGLAMRWPVRDTPQGRKAVDSVRKGERDGLSVGVRIERSLTGSEDGVHLRYVKEARLSEISLVRKGACAPAFCTVIDAETSLGFEHDCKSLRMLSDGAYVAVVRAIRALTEE